MTAQLTRSEVKKTIRDRLSETDNALSEDRIEEMVNSMFLIGVDGLALVGAQALADAPKDEAKK